MASSSGRIPPNLSFDQDKIADDRRGGRGFSIVVIPAQHIREMINILGDGEDKEETKGLEPVSIAKLGEVVGTRGRGQDEARKGTDEATGLGYFYVLVPLFGQSYPKIFRAGDEVLKRMEEGTKLGYANAKREEEWGFVFEEGGEVRIKIGSGTNETDSNRQTLFEDVEKKKKVMEEMTIALTGQAAISLMGYYLSSPALPGEAKYVAGATAVGFLGSLASLLLGEKYKRAAPVLGQIGAIAASSAIITAMTMSLPAEHRLWVNSLASLLPVGVVALARDTSLAKSGRSG